MSLRVSHERVLSPDVLELVQLERILPRGGGGGDVVLPADMGRRYRESGRMTESRGAV